MSAVDFLDNVSLKAIRPVKLVSSYDRTAISPGEKEVKLALQSAYGEETADSNKFILKFTASAEVVETTSSDGVFNVIFEVDYCFDIINAEKIVNITNEDRTTISASIVYLDFRSRLLRILADASLSSVKVPLSPINNINPE